MGMSTKATKRLPTKKERELFDAAWAVVKHCRELERQGDLKGGPSGKLSSLIYRLSDAVEEAEYKYT